MNVTITAPKPKILFPRAKIRNAVKEIMPRNQTFELKVQDSGIREMKIVRVVTDAWKKQWAGDRIERVLNAVNGKLTPEEQKSILRFSVLTPDEYKQLVQWTLPKPNLRSKSLQSTGVALEARIIDEEINLRYKPMEKYDLIHDDNQWKLRKEGAERSTKVFETTKEEAVKQSAEFMREHGGSLRIHKEDGKFQEERTYPRADDPRQSPG